MSWNGLLLIDKPSGGTSHDVVARLRKMLNMSAIGHSGTLDPLASGLMVMLLGQATKLSDYILSQDKRYLVELKLGMTTDTGDRDCQQVLRDEKVELAPSLIQQAALDLVGELELAVPIFSATKVQGKKLYEYARSDRAVEIPRKIMRFYDVSTLEAGGDRLVAEVSCSKGGYIRSWVTALGEKLGVGATVMELRRLASTPYHVHEAITLERLTALVREEKDAQKALGPAFIPMAQALPGWVSCLVRGREEQLLRNGQISHDLTNRLVVAQKQAHASQKAVGIKVIGDRGDLVGLLEALPLQGLKIRRIFAS